MNTPTRLELLGHWIDGAAVADTVRLAPVTNPATGEIARQVAMASKTTVESAIAAAQAAFPAWRATAPVKRAHPVRLQGAARETC
jgi:malonate-semialdehyde dehydrogenase (acetylating)/methylmalonate-semialdehyde dehydrogenase